MAQQFDNRQGRGKSADISTDTQLDKAKMPEQNRQEVRKGLHPDNRKGAEVLNQGVRDRSGDYGRDAVLDPSRQARPQMMAMISTVFPELSASQSPQRDAFIKAFENPALIRSYLINPQETTAYLSQRFPDMKGTLEKNMPFQKVGSHIEVNPDSAMYQRVKQEVQIGLKPSDSFIKREMDKLLSSPFGASLGGSSGMETKAYDLVRNRIETNGQFNKAAERIELRMTKLMTSPQATQDLKEAKGLAAMGPLGASATTPSAAQGVPTTNGTSVQGPLKPVQGNQPAPTTPPPSSIPTTTGVQVQGTLTPVAPPTPAPGISVPGIAATAGAAGISVTGTGPQMPQMGTKISVPGIAATAGAAGISVTGTGPQFGTKISVPEAPKPPVVEATPTKGAVPTTDGTVVQGELKPVSPAAAAPAAKPEEPKAQPAAAPAAKPEEPKAQPAAVPAAKPEEPKAQPAPAPSAASDKLSQENKLLTETIAKLNATLEKNNAAMEAMTKKLQESDARAAAAEATAAAAQVKEKESAAQIEALKQLVEENRRERARDNLKSEVNELLADKNQKRATSKELDEAVKTLTKPDQKELPSADDVVAKISETREAAKLREVELRKERARQIGDEMAKLPANADIKQTRAWVDANMQLYNSFDAQGKKDFTTYIQNTYNFQQNRETFDPMIFFNRKIADAVVLELKGATTSDTWRPQPMGPGAVPQTVTIYRPDIVKIAEVLRSVEDLKAVGAFVQANPEVGNLKNKFPKDGWLSPEDGAFQKSIDARLVGNKVEAEAHLIRALISSGQVVTKEQRQKIQEARKNDPSQTAAIDEFYQKTYGKDIGSEVRTANKAALEKATQAEAELKAAQEKAKKAKEAASDLLE